MAKENGLFSQVRQRLDAEAKDVEKKAEERIKKLRAKEEKESVNLNPEWDKQEKELVEEVKTLSNFINDKSNDQEERGMNAKKLQMLSLAMLMQTQMGKNAHLRNGARRVLMQTIDVLFSLEPAEKQTEEAKAEHAKARGILEGDMEDESAK